MRRGVDFAQAELATKIRGKYLRALEDEQFELLPAETYVKGFLRTYAEYLGLDGQLYVDEYNSRFVTGEDYYEARRSHPRRSTARPPRRSRRTETNIVLIALAARRDRRVGLRARARRQARPQRPVPRSVPPQTRLRAGAHHRGR